MTDPQAILPPEEQDLDSFLGVKAENPWLRRGKWIGIGVLALVMLYVLYRCFGPAEAAQYSTQAARNGDLTVTVSATGNIKPINQVDVGSQQSGLITHVYVDVNDRVTRGQLLATLDTARLQDTVTQAQAGVAAARANAGEAQATLALANATLARQEEVFRLSNGRVPSRTELDSARADQRRAVASLAPSRAQVAQQQAALGAARTDLGRAQIYSPVTGVVLSRDIEPGQTVAASLNAPVLFTIAEDLSRMELEVSIDEADVGQVQQGQAATFTVDAFPGKRFPAQITRVNVGSNTTTSSSSSSSSTSSSSGNVVAYTALLSVDNTQQELRPGMTATADIVTMQKHNVLLIPNAALRFRPTSGAAASSSSGITGALVPRGPRRGGNSSTRSVTTERGAQQTVYIVDDAGKPKAIQVTTGDTNGSTTEVTSGELRAGMRVITGQLATGATQSSSSSRGGGGAGGGSGGGGRGGAGRGGG